MFLSVSDQWRAALNAETLALNQNKVAAVENIAGGVAALIGGRRAQAAVEGAFDTAKAIEMWARFAASWGTDAGAALAAAQYTIAAAQMFQIAASGGGSAIPGGKLYNSSGGGGGLAAGTSATFGPPNALAPGAASALGKPATGVTIIFQGPVYGGKAGIRELATHLSDAVEQHDVRLVSLYTRRSVPVTGR